MKKLIPLLSREAIEMTFGEHAKLEGRSLLAYDKPLKEGFLVKTTDIMTGEYSQEWVSKEIVLRDFVLESTYEAFKEKLVMEVIEQKKQEAIKAKKAEELTKDKIDAKIDAIKAKAPKKPSKKSKPLSKQVGGEVEGSAYNAPEASLDTKVTFDKPE
jgi:hypothetical protein